MKPPLLSCIQLVRHIPMIEKHLSWPRFSLKFGTPIIASFILANCTGLGYTPPPTAKLGDAFLALTVSTNDRGRMPQGADIVISIENEKAADPEKKVIIGDVIKLTQSDTAVKVNFPIDRSKLANCGKTIDCRIHVKIMKNGSARYKNNELIAYKAGQTKATITVNKPI